MAQSVQSVASGICKNHEGLFPMHVIYLHSLVRFFIDITKYPCSLKRHQNCGTYLCIDENVVSAFTRMGGRGQSFTRGPNRIGGGQSHVIDEGERVNRRQPTPHRVWQTVSVEQGTYTGWMEGNKFHGFGVMVYNLNHPQNWHSYTGYWRDGKFDGHGILLYITSARYCGEWKEGRRHGDGMMFYDPYADPPVTFVGKFKKDKKESGTLSCRTREGMVVSYEGVFLEGQFHGDAWIARGSTIMKRTFNQGDCNLQYGELDPVREFRNLGR